MCDTSSRGLGMEERATFISRSRHRCSVPSGAKSTSPLRLFPSNCRENTHRREEGIYYPPSSVQRVMKSSAPCYSRISAGELRGALYSFDLGDRVWLERVCWEEENWPYRREKYTTFLVWERERERGKTKETEIRSKLASLGGFFLSSFSSASSWETRVEFTALRELASSSSSEGLEKERESFVLGGSFRDLYLSLLDRVS